MWRLRGSAFTAALSAALLLSVAHDVKSTSHGCAPKRPATCSRAPSTTFLILAPKPYVLEELSHVCKKREHRFAHLRSNRGRRVVIEVNHRVGRLHE